MIAYATYGFEAPKSEIGQRTKWRDQSISEWKKGLIVIKINGMSHRDTDRVNACVREEEREKKRNRKISHPMMVSRRYTSGFIQHNNKIIIIIHPSIHPVDHSTFRTELIEMRKMVWCTFRMRRRIFQTVLIRSETERIVKKCRTLWPEVSQLNLMLTGFGANASQCDTQKIVFYQATHKVDCTFNRISIRLSVSLSLFYGFVKRQQWKLFWPKVL